MVCTGKGPTGGRSVGNDVGMSGSMDFNVDSDCF